MTGKGHALTQKRYAKPKGTQVWAASQLHQLAHAGPKRMKRTAEVTYGVKIDWSDQSWRQCVACSIARRSGMPKIRKKNITKQGVLPTVALAPTNQLATVDSGVLRGTEFDQAMEHFEQKWLEWRQHVNIPVIAARGPASRFTTLEDHYVFGTLFLDNKDINIRNCPQYGGLNTWLVITDMVSTRVWVLPIQSKKFNGIAWREFVVKHQLHKADLPITCITDGDGAMKPVEEVNNRMGISHVYLPPGAGNHPGEIAVRRAVEGATAAYLQGNIPAKYFTLLGGAVMMVDAYHATTGQARFGKPSMKLTTGYQVYLPDMYPPGTIGFCRPLPSEKNKDGLAVDSIRYQKALLCKLIDWPDTRQPTLYRVLIHATQHLRVTNQIVFLRGVFDTRASDFGTNEDTLGQLVNDLLPTDWAPYAGELNIQPPILPNPEDHIFKPATETTHLMRRQMQNVATSQENYQTHSVKTLEYPYLIRKKMKIR